MLVIYVIVGAIVLLLLSTVIFVNSPRFGQSPRGERLRRIEQSPNYHDGQFHNQIPTPKMVSDGRNPMLEFIFGKKPELLRPEKPILNVKTDLKDLRAKGEDAVVWLGHSSYFMLLDGKTVLIDPVLEAGAPLGWMNPMFPMKQSHYTPQDMPSIDLLIITHDHWDHLDYLTLKKLRNRIRKVVCPLGVGQHLEYWKFPVANIHELDWYENAEIWPGFTVYAMPARHFSGRFLESNKTLWASYIIKSSRLTVFAGGDSGYGPHFKEIGEQFPDIDMALVENGQYSKNWPYIHTVPEHLHDVIKDVNPKRVITGHHSMFALARHPYDEPVNNALKLMDSLQGIEIIVRPIGTEVKL